MHVVGSGPLELSSIGREKGDGQGAGRRPGGCRPQRRTENACPHGRCLWGAGSIAEAEMPQQRGQEEGDKACERSSSNSGQELLGFFNRLQSDSMCRGHEGFPGGTDGS